MTVPSASEDTNSSDDVYSSVPDTISEHIEALDEKGFLRQRNDKLGPLPAVPNNMKENTKHMKHTLMIDSDANNNRIRKGTLDPSRKFPHGRILRKIV